MHLGPIEKQRVWQIIAFGQSKNEKQVFQNDLSTFLVSYLFRDLATINRNAPTFTSFDFSYCASMCEFYGKNKPLSRPADLILCFCLQSVKIFLLLGLALVTKIQITIKIFEGFCTHFLIGIPCTYLFLCLADSSLTAV